MEYLSAARTICAGTAFSDNCSHLFFNERIARLPFKLTERVCDTLGECDSKGRFLATDTITAISAANADAVRKDAK